MAGKLRLRDGKKAQERQAKARTQLTVRVNAPTGTATFDLLVKLVGEARRISLHLPLIYSVHASGPFHI